MDTLVNSVHTYIQTFSLNNPASYLVVVLLCLAVLRKWSILLLTLLTYILASIARDLIVMNLQNAHVVVGVPMVIYCIGGFLIALVALIGFVRYMLT
jgi:hypothetical protein